MGPLCVDLSLYIYMHHGVTMFMSVLHARAHTHMLSDSLGLSLNALFARAHYTWWPVNTGSLTCPFMPDDILNRHRSACRSADHDVWIKSLELRVCIQVRHAMEYVKPWKCWNISILMYPKRSWNLPRWHAPKWNLRVILWWRPCCALCARPNSGSDWWWLNDCGMYV